MVEKAPEIPPSADSFAARLAAIPSPAGRMAEITRQIDSLIDAIWEVETEAKAPHHTSCELLSASVRSDWLTCAMAPTSLNDCLILARAAIGPAEYLADNQDAGDLQHSSRAVVTALAGIVDHLESVA
ncbi:hypothetical protein GG804_26230 [Sphingomonas histidinilytica]|uniref:hypothetical protein n=1 Tax=Rhizorhabdus histidinilytica TaxID=439228 RepID=UPI001ADD155B|nr:hypothetical protein [Rhizorhabdus histidinilytica]MBO9380267.1 hypothetical protein [Rhizorhabdus histidinilytica]